jgi:hypothetical protein
MDAAQTIRDAVFRVSRLREIYAADPDLAGRVNAVKSFQACRFAGTYSDLLAGGAYCDAARFFLEELYSDKDYADRDTQFGRIAGALQTLFPKQVVATAVSLAQLHRLTEEMDHAMATTWAGGDVSGNLSTYAQYFSAWQAVGRRAERNRQLQVVQEIGRELARLTRMPGLRLMLRMMRKPAHAAGLGSLQDFLESGFDTFAGMSRQPHGVETFLSIVEKRESALIDLLFDGDPVACETELAVILGRAHGPTSASAGKIL